MASGPRQFIAKFISDLSNFNTDRAARGLEELGDEYQQTERRMESMEDSARETARGVDDSFDRIRRASRNTGDGFRDMEGEAHEGMAGVADEASETAREVGSSFDGSFESIGEGFQELAANAGASFGPIGLAAGLLAAGALGSLSGRLEETKERAEALGEGMRAVARGSQTVAEASLDFQDSLNPGQFQDWSQAAEDAGVSVQTYTEAMLGSAEAQDKVAEGMARQEEAGSGLSRWMRGFQEEVYKRNQADADTLKNIPLLGDAQQWWTDLLAADTDVQARNLEEKKKQVQATQEQYEATQRASEATEAFSTVTSDATDSAIESFKNAEGEVVYSLEAIGSSLNAQTKAAEEYAANVAIALQKGVSQEAVSYLMDLPDGGARAFAELAAGTDASIQDLNGKVGQFTLAKQMTATIRDEKGNLIQVTGDNMAEVQRKIDAAGLSAKIQVTQNGAESVAAMLSRLSTDRTVRITASLVGGAAEYLQGSRRIR